MGEQIGRKNRRIRRKYRAKRPSRAAKTLYCEPVRPPAEPAARRCFFCAGVLLGVYFFFFFAGLDAIRYSEKISDIFFVINVRHDRESVLIILGAWG